MIRKISALCIPLCLLALLVSGCAKESGSDKRQEHPVYSYYTEIPGVSPEQIAAVEALKSRSAGFSIGMNLSTEAFLRGDGGVGGFTSLFCAWLEGLFGIPFQTKILDWDALLAGLNDKSIDFTGELTATPERRNLYFMTDPIAQRMINIFRLDHAERLAVLAQERPLRYGFLEGSTGAGYIAEVSDQTFTSVFVQDYAEAVRLLNEGALDAFFEDSSAEAAFDVYPDIVSENFFPLIYTPVSLSTANPELLPIIEVVQIYLGHGALYHLTGLYNEGQNEYRRHKLYGRLSEAEKDYLRQHQGGPAIPIAAEFDNYPYSFYNKTEKQWQGMAYDVLGEISDLTGLIFEPNNQPDTTWPELLRRLENNEVALITELIPSEERRGEFIWPDEPYAVDNYALISLSGQDNIRINQILYSTVGIAEDTAYQEVFEKWFPDHQSTKIYASMDDCFLALEKGEVDFVMASRNLMLSMTNYSEKPGFKVNILFSNTYESSFGLNINQRLLRSIISQAQKLVDTESISQHWIHRVFDYRAKLARTQIPYLIGLAALLFVVMALLFIMLQHNRKQGRTLELLVKQRTAELEVQTEAARQASLAKSEFLSRMSHEIRTPLNAVIGMAQVGRQIPGLPPKAVESNEEIITASNHLLQVLNDVLDMAKIESGKFSLAEEPFELRQAMLEVAKIMEQRSLEKKIELRTNLETLPAIAVNGDKMRLKQVLINLLGNAVKFTEPGGKISFLVSQSAQDGNAVAISFAVEDNGIGMRPDQVARLFTAFEQADSSVAAKYGGTGLGLAISQNMVRGMGGEIEVRSETGRGSRFSFRISLPRADLAEKSETALAPPDLTGRRILLVEDIEINRLILAELLADTGVELEMAEDGQSGLDKFAASKPGYYDLILMDVQMPRLDGYQTTRAIRALPRSDASGVPILAMTANAYKEDIEKALLSGMNDHLAKPVDLDILREKLRTYLARA